jgi:transglutaminase-like putative cysteine protease
MLLKLTHETRYHYTPSVENAQHVLHLKPANHAGQQLLSHSLQIIPEPAGQREITDVFGNSSTFFSLRGEHDRLCVTANSLVKTSALQLATSTTGIAWESVREQFRYRAGVAYSSAWEFLFASHYVPRNAAFVDFAQPSFTPKRPLPEAAHDLMQRIHRHMKYESHSTKVNTPALEALQQGKGVCQDFAHIMVACCRAMGLPARYVSGYMLTQPPAGQARLIGSDASHAWASVYSPMSDGSNQWLDYDPTNDRAPGEDYVTLATGRDFLDVSPLRGVIRGGAKHILTVAVTVMPVSSLLDESI